MRGHLLLLVLGRAGATVGEAPLTKHNTKYITAFTLIVFIGAYMVKAPMTRTHAIFFHFIFFTFPVNHLPLLGILLGEPLPGHHCLSGGEGLFPLCTFLFFLCFVLNLLGGRGPQVGRARPFFFHAFIYTRQTTSIFSLCFLAGTRVRLAWAFCPAHATMSV
uniref:Uncharacterized protein n=1 Tax=Lotharella oceanica TaxID=641309 RepID=A0A7S2TRP5_9EUKA